MNYSYHLMKKAKVKNRNRVRNRNRSRNRSRSGKTRDELIAENEVKVVEDMLLNVYSDG